MSLTPAEIDLVQKLSECMDAFTQLINPSRMPESIRRSDLNEFAQGVHVLQRQVMARSAQRLYPELYVRGAYL